MPKVREHIPEEVIANAAKWRKKSLRRKYIHGKKVPSVALARKHGKKEKHGLLTKESAQEFAADLAAFKRKAKSQFERTQKIRSKGGLQRNNAEFIASQKGRMSEMSKLDQLAWQSIVSDEQLFENCGTSSMFQSISAEEFGQMFDLDQLQPIEEQSFGTDVADGHAEISDDRSSRKSSKKARLSDDSDSKNKRQQQFVDDLRLPDIQDGIDNDSEQRSRISGKKRKQPEKSEQQTKESIEQNSPKKKKVRSQSKSMNNHTNPNETGGTKTKKKSVKNGRSFRSQIDELRPQCDLSEMEKHWSQFKKHGPSDLPSCDRFGLNIRLVRSLASLGFDCPTLVQQRVLDEVLKQRPLGDLMIAAPTGSGKTLAFSLAILQDLLMFSERMQSKPIPGFDHRIGVKCLIITPTRELALQIESHLSPLLRHCEMHSALLVGGMSEAKQRRQLSSVKKPPSIVVATPGRLWALMDELNLSHLRYLVLDEADRLLSSTHFGEMDAIMEVVKTEWNHRDELLDSLLVELMVCADMDSIDGSSDSDRVSDDDDNDASDPDDWGMPEDDDEGGASIMTLKKESSLSRTANDLAMFPLAEGELAKGKSDAVTKLEQLTQSIREKRLVHYGLQHCMGSADASQLRAIREGRCSVLVSATLCLDSSGRDSKAEQRVPVLANVTRLVPLNLERVTVMDLSDLSVTRSSVSSISSSSSKTPSSLPLSAVTIDGPVKEFKVMCDEKDKDAIAFYLCIEGDNDDDSTVISSSLTRQIHSKSRRVSQRRKKMLKTGANRTLVFANTIGTVRRLAMILSKMGLPRVWALHSSQQQKQRLKNLDRFVSNEKSVLVCTDLAARGLDIPLIDRVIHFHAPLTVEDYVHRRGRAGRIHATMADESVAALSEDAGVSIILSCAKESKQLKNLTLSAAAMSAGIFDDSIREYSLNEAKLSLIKRRAKLVKEIVRIEEKSTVRRRKVGELERMAESAGIALDELNAPHLRSMRGGTKIRGHRAKDMRNMCDDDAEELNEKLQRLKNELNALLEGTDLNRKRTGYLHRNTILL